MYQMIDEDQDDLIGCFVDWTEEEGRFHSRKDHLIISIIILLQFVCTTHRLSGIYCMPFKCPE